jgi:hypothetical protein
LSLIVDHFEAMKEFNKNFPFVAAEVEKFVKIYRYEQGANRSYVFDVNNFSFLFIIFNINKIDVSKSGDINEYVIRKLNQNLNDLHAQIYGL